MSDTLRLGVIGMGNMGTGHCGYLSRGAVTGANLAAVCDVNPATAAAAGEKYGVPGFTSHAELLRSNQVDAVIVAVPHYDHVPICIDAFGHGLHVMCEKPIAVSVTAARQVNAAYADVLKTHPNLKFGIMFQARTDPKFLKVRDLITGGDLGTITRISWIATQWFRSCTYYASGGWRATWKGEGGGVLINQCPHNLDVLQWATGLMPSRITAVGSVGKFHPIEVEDEVIAILEYPNGATGTFHTTTAEYPGTNRLEIAGDRGKIVAEDGSVTFHRTAESVSHVNKHSPKSFPDIETWKINVPVDAGKPAHSIVLQRWIDVIRGDRPNSDLLAEGTEGVHGLEIGNAMLMSALTRRPVELPVDGAAYDRFIDDMASAHGGRKSPTGRTPASESLENSFAP